MREIPHFSLFPAFPHFLENVPHFWLYFEKQKIPENRDILGARKKCVCNSSFTLKDFCLNDKISSSTGRSAAAHISRTSHASPLVFSAPGEIILFTTWLLLAATGGMRMSEKMLARPDRRRTPTKLIEVRGFST